MKRWLYIMLLLLASTIVRANGDTLSVAERNAMQGFNDTIDRMAEDFVEVSLVVCDPGTVLFSTFGHAVLHLQCPAFGKDYIFSYESEEKSGNWLRFLSGDLKEGMFGIPSDEYFQYYRKEGIKTLEYKLNLTPMQEQELWRNIDQLVARGADLPYDYYTRGCALSIVRVIKQSLQGTPIEYGEWPSKFEGTLRELGYECVTKAHQPWNRFALMTLAGSDIDNPRIPKEKKLIVPSDLAEVWQHATIDGKPLISEDPHIIVQPTGQQDKPWCTPLMVGLVLLVLALCSLVTLRMPRRGLQIVGEVIDYSILAVVTLLGAIIGYTVFFSTLPCTSWNWLILPFNILPAIGWYWRKYWALLWAIVLLVWSIVMTGEWLCGRILVEWAHIMLTLTFVIILIKQYIKVKKG